MHHNMSKEKKQKLKEYQKNYSETNKYLIRIKSLQFW